MKIKKLRLKNFQRHIDKTIEFHPGLNIITGPTDVGKSSILRAIRKVIRDLPAGNSWTHFDHNEFIISLLTDKDELVKRRVSRTDDGTTKDNEYIVGKIDSEGQEHKQKFAGFGREIPIEVNSVLNMPLIELDDGTKIDLHFAGQHDASFLISEKPSTKSKILGRISGLNVIDIGIQKTNKDARQRNGKLKNINEEIQRLLGELKKFDDLEALEEKSDRLNVQLMDVMMHDSNMQRLIEFQAQLKAIVDQGKQIRTELAALPTVDLDDFLKIKERITQWNMRKISLHNLLTQHDQICSQINILENDTIFERVDINPKVFDDIRVKLQRVDKLKGLREKWANISRQIQTLENDSVMKISVESLNTQSVKDKITRVNLLRTLEKGLNTSNTEIITLENDVITLEGQEIQRKSEWEELLREAGICPTCKQSTREVKFS